MRATGRIKVMLFAIVCTVVSSFITLLIDEIIRPDRDMLVLNLKYLVYIMVLSIALIGGLIISISILITQSLWFSLLTSIIVGATISLGIIRGAIEIYTNTTFFDAPMFYADVIQVFLTLGVYVGACLLSWQFYERTVISTN